MTEIRRFEDIELGDDLPEMFPDVSLEQVKLFVATAGMHFPRFTNHEAANRLLHYKYRAPYKLG